jgi:threonine synthase
MRYISTRGGDTADFSTTVLAGLARDGGLFMPKDIPNVSRRLPEWRSLPYQELAWEIIRLYTDLPPDDLRHLIQNAYTAFTHPEITPLRRLGDIHLLELFHGPTLAFKDLALQFLGGLFEYLLARNGGQLNILAATSGDTGSAAIHGVRGRERLRIFVLYPHGRISPAQELQMITVPDSNVHTMALQGTFDDCQQIVKTLLGDLPFRDRCHLGAVNSINWARILAQVVYYFYATFRVMKETGCTGVRFAVPTGNFGDIFAGYIAWRMGLPIRRLVLATNENDILARFFQTGIYERGPVRATVSPSMDIQVASNFERYLYCRADGDAGRLKEQMNTFAQTGRIQLPPGPEGKIDPLFCSGAADTAATLATIREYYNRYDNLLDPHTAAGVYVAQQFIQSDEPMICLATAHPAKFGDAVRQAVGKDLAHHPVLDNLAGLPTRRNVCPAEADAVRTFIEQRL